MFLLLLASYTFANSMPLLQLTPAKFLRNEVVTYQPVPNHHFSAEAPQKCGSGQMIEKSPRSISCQFVKSGVTTVLLNICDDKKTFCKPTELSVQVLEQVSSQKRLAPVNPQAVAKLNEQMIPGFTQGTPSEIRARAKSLRQPVFVMISTQWCPPCNETKEYLFPSKGFKDVSANWFKVYVDGDSPAAQEWQKVVPYHQFPTMALLNDNLEEIGRYVRELREGEFKRWSLEVNADYKFPIAGLMKKDQLSQSEANRLLRWGIESESVAAIEKARPLAKDFDSELKILLASHDLENAEDSKKKILLKEMMSLTENGDDFEDYLDMMCGLDKKVCKIEAQKLPKRIEAFKSRKDFSPIERAAVLGEMALSQYGIYKTLGQIRNAKDVAKLCAEQYEFLAKNSNLETPRASHQALIYCLEFAGKDKAAEALVEKMAKAYPDEPTFLIRMARLKQSQKKLNEAHDWVEKAEKLAYGYNWYTAVLLKANIEVEQKRKAEALATLEQALVQVDLPSDKDLRNHSLVKRIRKLQASIQK